jgi:hypothetical protein
MPQTMKLELNTPACRISVEGIPSSEMARQMRGVADLIYPGVEEFIPEIPWAPKDTFIPEIPWDHAAVARARKSK